MRCPVHGAVCTFYLCSIYAGAVEKLLYELQLTMAQYRARQRKASASSGDRGTVSGPKHTVFCAVMVINCSS
jgi:hypothetical protein